VTGELAIGKPSAPGPAAEGAGGARTRPPQARHGGSLEVGGEMEVFWGGRRPRPPAPTPCGGHTPCVRGGSA
jgi:hypothetical protein